LERMSGEEILNERGPERGNDTDGHGNLLRIAGSIAYLGIRLRGFLFFFVLILKKREGHRAFEANRRQERSLNVRCIFTPKQLFRRFGERAAMALVAFPLVALRGGPIRIELNALTVLASQASELIRQDQPAELHALLQGHGIRLCEQGQAVRELAIGFSLSYRGNSSLEIEQIERVARRVVESGLEGEVALAEQRDYLIIGAALAIPEAGYPSGTSEYFERLIGAARRIERIGPIDDVFSRSWTQRNIAKILSKSDKSGRAREVFEEAIASARQLRPEHEYSIHFVEYPLHKIASDLTKAGHRDRAREIYEETIASLQTVREVSRLARGYLAIASGLAEIGDRDRARKFFLKAIVSASRLGRFEQLGRLASAVAAFGDDSLNLPLSNLFERHIVSARKIKPDYDRPWVQAGIALALARSGLAERSQEVFEEVVSLARELKYWSLLSHTAKLLAAAGRVDRSLEIFDEARGFFIRFFIQRSPRERLWNVETLVLDLVWSGLVDRALEIFGDEITAAWSAEAPVGRRHIAFEQDMERIESVISDHDLGDRFLGLFDRLVPACRTIKNPDRRTEAIRYVAQHLANGGYKDRAKEILQTITPESTRR